MTADGGAREAAESRVKNSTLNSAAYVSRVQAALRDEIPATAARTYVPNFRSAIKPREARAHRDFRGKKGGIIRHVVRPRTQRGISTILLP
jgi:hypothetical protein